MKKKTSPGTFLLNFLMKLRNDNVGACSAQAAFFMVMSFFPFLMFILMFLFRMRFLNQEFIRSLLISATGRIFPGDFEPVLDGLIQEIVGLVEYQNSQSSTMYIWTAVIALWVSGKGIMALMFGLNSVNGNTESRNYVAVRVQSSLYALIFTVAVFAGGLIMMYGSSLEKLLETHYGTRMAPILGVLVNYHGQVTIAGLVILFVCIYRFLPDAHVSLFSCISGALFTAVGWSILSFGFSIYLTSSTNRNLIYGSLTNFVMILMWLYFCMYILLIGAEISCYQDAPEQFEFTTIEAFVDSIPKLKKTVKFVTAWRIVSYMKKRMKRDGIWLNTCWDVDPSLYPRKGKPLKRFWDGLKKALFFGYILVRMETKETENYQGEEAIVQRFDSMEKELSGKLRNRATVSFAAILLGFHIRCWSSLIGTKAGNWIEEQLDIRITRKPEEKRLSGEQLQGALVMTAIGVILIFMLVI